MEPIHALADVQVIVGLVIVRVYHRLTVQLAAADNAQPTVKPDVRTPVKNHAVIHAPADVMKNAMGVQELVMDYVIPHVPGIVMPLALLIIRLRLEILGTLRQMSLLKSEIIGEVVIKYI